MNPSPRVWIKVLAGCTVTERAARQTCRLGTAELVAHEDEFYSVGRAASVTAKGSNYPKHL